MGLKNRRVAIQKISIVTNHFKEERGNFYLKIKLFPIFNINVIRYLLRHIKRKGNDNDKMMLSNIKASSNEVIDDVKYRLKKVITG